jgi:small-conductance mechanosensitive channel
MFGRPRDSFGLPKRAPLHARSPPAVKPLDKLTLAALGLLLAAAVAGYVSTARDDSASAAHSGAAPATGLIDRRPLQTAQRLAALADTPEETELAREAMRLGDHSIDLAFTIALLEAAEHPPVPTPETREIRARIDSTERLIAEDSTRAARLVRVAASGADADRVETERELINAQLDLHRGELADAKDDLIRAGGDPQGRIRQMVADHDSTEHGATGSPKPAAPTGAASVTKEQAGLLGKIERWRALNDKQTALKRAQEETTAGIPALTTQRQDFIQHTSQLQSDPAGDQLSRTRHLSADQKVLAGLTQRIEDQVSLLDTYSRWGSLVAEQHRAALRVVLLDCVWLLLIFLAAVALGGWLERLFGRLAPERRRLQTLRTVTRFAIRGVALVAAVLILIGPPSQLATIIGLAGAGLTVALKDFIVGFFGWFALMGRNGIRVGDWVEINGVSGVVIEITPFHTVLFETGNWTEAGHPTGRQVTFNNAFAIEGHYFNFSTSGQWLWDEVAFELPSANAPAVIQAIRTMVTEETAENARLAEQEWGRVTTARAVTGFSAEPAIDVRPGPGGTHVLVRYIIQAQERHRFRTRLNQTVVDLLGQPEPAVPRS